MPVYFRVESKDVMRSLQNLAAEDAPFVTAYALTKTGQDIKEAELRSMKDVFDRPTRFTLNALFLKPATKRDLVAEVYFKEGFGSIPAWRYLGPQVEGGPRVHKAHERRLIAAGHMRSNEFAVPGQGIKLDQYGNIPGSTIERILSQVKAAGGSGYEANATNSRRSKAKRKNGQYFVLRPGSNDVRANRNVAPGIYYRSGMGGMVPVIMFVKPPRYQKRLPFYEIAERVFNERLVPRAREGFQRFVVSRLPKAV